MQKKFLSSLFILLSLNLLIKPFWILGIDRTVQNISGATEYGFYFALLNFSLLFNILLDLGITNFNNRNISQNEHLLKKQFLSISFLKFSLAFLYVIATFSAAYFLGYNSRQFYFLIFLSVNQFLLSFILYLRSNIAGLQLFKTDALLSVLDRLLLIVFCSFLLWSGLFNQKFKIEWYLYAQTLAYTLSFIVCFIVVASKANLTLPKINIKDSLSIIKQSAPFASLILLMTFYNRVDSVMLERLIENGEFYVGVYAAAFRLLDAFNMLPYLFAVILLPLFSRMIKKNLNVQPIIKTSFNLLIVVSTFVALFSLFNSNQIINLLYIENITQAAEVFSILVFCFIPVSLTYIFGTLLTANGNLKHLNLIALSGMLINIFFNILLIPNFQALGSAYVSLFTQSFTAILQVLLCIKIFSIKINYLYLAKILVQICTTITILLVLKHLNFGLISTLIISGFTVVLSSLLLGIFNPRSIIELVSYKKNNSEF